MPANPQRLRELKSRRDHEDRSPLLGPLAGRALMDAEIAYLEALQELTDSPWAAQLEALKAQPPKRGRRAREAHDAVAGALVGILEANLRELEEKASAAEEEFQRLSGLEKGRAERVAAASRPTVGPPRAAPGWKPAMPADLLRIPQL